MVKRDKVKKKIIDYKGMKVNQPLLRYKFVKEFTKWVSDAQNTSGAEMQVKNIPTLYDFFKSHLKSTVVRDGSRNNSGGHVNEGTFDILEDIERIIQRQYISKQDALYTQILYEDLEEMKDTGEDIGGEGKAHDPAFIVFSHRRVDKKGKAKAPKKYYGHYADEEYAEKFKVAQAKSHWLTGENIPHQALFSEKGGKDFPSRGLMYILKDAQESIENEKLEIDEVPIDDEDFKDWEAISSIESFFNKVVRTSSYWKDGRLLVNAVRKEFESVDFKLNGKEAELVEKITKLNVKEAPAGKLGIVRLSSSPEVIVFLTKSALERKTKEVPKKAPDGKPAWQNRIKGERGFDYRTEGSQDITQEVRTKRLARELAKIPEIKRYAQSLLRDTSLYDGANFQTSRALNKLKDKEFNFSPTSKNKILDLFNLSDVRKVNFKMTKLAMKELLNRSVITRTRDLQSMNAPNTKEPIVLKSWQQLLWRQ